jgi:hypothetical protein
MLPEERLLSPGKFDVSQMGTSGFSPVNPTDLLENWQPALAVSDG